MYNSIALTWFTYLSIQSFHLQCSSCSLVSCYTFNFGMLLQMWLQFFLTWPYCFYDRSWSLFFISLPLERHQSSPSCSFYGVLSLLPSAAITAVSWIFNNKVFKEGDEDNKPVNEPGNNNEPGVSSEYHPLIDTQHTNVSGTNVQQC